MRVHYKYKFLTTAVLAASVFVAACAGPATSVANPSTASQAVATVAASTTDPTATLATPVLSAATPVPPTAMAAAIAAASTAIPTAIAPISASAAAAATPTAATAVSTTAAAAATAATITYKVVASGTKADYRVREQLVRLSAPSDAVGTTTGVTGSIVLGADGTIVSDQSKLVVDLSTLQSDSNMRDGFVGNNTLNLSQYPNATFVPTAITGLTAPLPTSGQQTFQLTGNLTIHGVTKPATFAVTSQVSGNDVTGVATTNFKFEDFGMTPPHAGAVLSVVDAVKLEITLHLTKSV
jgi:polyisoprenoid-binding protein YceI